MTVILVRRLGYCGKDSDWWYVKDSDIYCGKGSYSDSSKKISSYCGKDSDTYLYD